jgi:hypothetical protein
MRLSDDGLALELRLMRPEPAPDFAAKLDRRAAEGFPRRTRRPSFLAKRSQLVPALGAVSLFVVVAGIAVGQSGVLGGGGGPVAPSVVETTGSGGGGVARDVQVPRGNAIPLSKDQTPVGPTAPTFGAPLDRVQQESGRGLSAQSADALRLRSAAGDLAPFVGHGHQAQRVDLGLATAPDDFRGAADGVFDVVRDHRGFVERSSVSGGDPGVPGAAPGHATYELRIPSGELSAALADLSNLGHVVSRTDGTLDITSRFHSANNRIDALTAKRDNLLEQLQSAVTITEQGAIHRQLRIVHGQLDAARHDLAEAQQRVHLTPVSVTIDSDSAVAGTGGSWSIGDALHDAGRVLVAMAGAILIGGAVLVPVALLALLAWLGWRAWRYRQRERALDTAPQSS